MLVVGESGGGKTVLINRLLLTDLLTWDILFIYTPSILQASYQVLIKGYNKGLSSNHILGIYAEQERIEDYNAVIECIASSSGLTQTRKVIGEKDPSKIPKPEDLSKLAMEEWQSLPINLNKKDVRKPRSIVLIDDAICSNQNAINKMFVYGRTYGIQVIYLTQAFFATKKNETRTNVNVFLLFRQSLNDSRMVFSRVCKDNRTFEEFYEFADKCWKKDRGFILLTCSPVEGTKYIDGELLLQELVKKEQQLYPI